MTTSGRHLKYPPDLRAMSDERRAPARVPLQVRVQIPPQERTPTQTETPAQAQISARTPAPPRPPSVWRALLALGVKVAALIVAFGLVFTFVYGVARVPDPGMASAVQAGDLVLFYRIDRDYDVGDLVALRYQEHEQVRRVVARGGDVVDIADGGLVINGSPQQEPNISEHTTRAADGVPFPLTVPDGQVFVLGDARQSATDSRVYGPVDPRNTQGRVITLIRWNNL